MTISWQECDIGWLTLVLHRVPELTVILRMIQIKSWKWKTSVVNRLQIFSDEKSTLCPTMRQSNSMKKWDNVTQVEKFETFEAVFRTLSFKYQIKTLLRCECTGRINWRLKELTRIPHQCMMSFEYMYMYMTCGWRFSGVKRETLPPHVPNWSDWQS